MVITSRTHTTLFASPSAKSLIRLPLSVVPHYEQRCEVTGAIVPTVNKPLFRANLWTSDEHERFLHGLEMFPNGPWKEVARIVGTKTTRQTMTHAQKYRQKIERRQTMKPKVLSKRSRRRHRATPVAPCEDTTSFQALMHANEPDVVLSDRQMTGQLPRVVNTAEDWDSEAFDISFLDQELDAILASLEPLPQLVGDQNFSSYAELISV